MWRSVCDIVTRETDIFVIFLDVSKVYDTVWREGLWMKMSEYGSGRIC